MLFYKLRNFRYVIRREDKYLSQRNLTFKIYIFILTERILILILKQCLKYIQIAKPKSYKNFTENAANVNTNKNYEDIYVAYSSDDVG